MNRILSLLKLFFPSKHLLNYLILMLLLVSQSSCFRHYYITNTTQSVKADTLKQLMNAKKQFIVHTPAGVFGLKNVKEDNDSLTGDKVSLDPRYDRYLNPEKDSANLVLRKEQYLVFEEVHLYTKNSFKGTGPVNLAINQIYRMDVYSRDRKAIKNSRTLSIVGLSIAAAGLIVGLNLLNQPTSNE
jgi:hypothetical protein